MHIAIAYPSIETSVYTRESLSLTSKKCSARNCCESYEDSRGVVWGSWEPGEPYAVSKMGSLSQVSLVHPLCGRSCRGGQLAHDNFKKFAILL